jgi:(p)ppGpp synthase/HD superfamily hydrolase
MLFAVSETGAPARDVIPALITGSDLLSRAFELARGAHEGQERKGEGTPYIGHPLAVATILAEAGLDEDAIAAALLHDVVEDSELDLGEIEKRFGRGVASLVDALTEDERIRDYEERKVAHREEIAEAGPRAVAIYAADKLSNVRDMRRGYARDGESVASRFEAPLDTRIRLWREDLQMASEVAPELPFLVELRTELDALEVQRAS